MPCGQHSLEGTPLPPGLFGKVHGGGRDTESRVPWSSTMQLMLLFHSLGSPTQREHGPVQSARFHLQAVAGDVYGRWSLVVLLRTPPAAEAAVFPHPQAKAIAFGSTSSIQVTGKHATVVLLADYQLSANLILRLIRVHTSQLGLSSLLQLNYISFIYQHCFCSVDCNLESLPFAMDTGLRGHEPMARGWLLLPGGGARLEDHHQGLFLAGVHCEPVKDVMFVFEYSMPSTYS